MSTKFHHFHILHIELFHSVFHFRFSELQDLAERGRRQLDEKNLREKVGVPKIVGKSTLKPTRDYLGRLKKRTERMEDKYL